MSTKRVTRKNKKVTYVVSMRVTADERRELWETMSRLQISKVSELMRQAMDLLNIRSRRNGAQRAASRRKSSPTAALPRGVHVNACASGQQA